MRVVSAAPVELRIPRLRELVRVARWTSRNVAALLGFTYDAVQDIELAVGEVCTNAVEHVREASRDEVLVRFSWDDRYLMIEVMDYGQGFRGGMEGIGLTLVGSVMDDVNISWDAACGTCVRMVKSRGGP